MIWPRWTLTPAMLGLFASPPRSLVVAASGVQPAAAAVCTGRRETYSVHLQVAKGES
jgi:hypothetical protein